MTQTNLQPPDISPNDPNWLKGLKIVERILAYIIVIYLAIHAGLNSAKLDTVQATQQQTKVITSKTLLGVSENITGNKQDEKFAQAATQPEH